MAQFTKYVSLDKSIITKEYRDNHICQEVERGTNARGEKEIVFASNDDGDAAFQVIINPDPNLLKDGKKCVKNADCPSGQTCWLKDGDPEKGICIK